MQHETGTVTKADSPRKRNFRGTIRERHWLTKKGEPRTTWQADLGFVNGKRRMRSFKTKDAAGDWLHGQSELLRNQGMAALALTEDQRVDAVRALGLLAKVEGRRLEEAMTEYVEACLVLKNSGTTIPDACKFFLKHTEPNGERRTVDEAVSEYLKNAKECKLRSRSCTDLVYRLRKLQKAFGPRLIASITRSDAEQWLAKMTQLSNVTKNHISTVAHGLWNFAMDHGYCNENIFARKRHRRRYQEDQKLPTCLLPSDVAKIMTTSESIDREVIPTLAIGFFAGLRTAELSELEWADIDLVAKRITVRPEVAKKRRTRHVSVEDNLVCWLAPYHKGKEGGRLTPKSLWRREWWKRLDTITEAAGVKWPFNAMRHSFASAHVAKYEDAAKTAFQLGHTQGNTSLLFEHYRSLMTPEDAKAYFEIRPAIQNQAAIKFPASA